MDLKEELEPILSSFDLPGTIVQVSVLERGRMHGTYVSVWKRSGAQQRYIHQRLNRTVFPDVECLMGNIAVVTRHLQDVLATSSDPTLTLVPTKDGAAFLRDEDGECWRCFEFIENTETFNVCPSDKVAREAGATVGRFLRMVDSLDVADLQEPIPGFVDTAKRFLQLEQAISEDPLGLAREASEEIEEILTNRGVGEVISEGLSSGRVPWKTCHLDTKLNNILFSLESGRGVCLVDLDTCMPGSRLYDYGDLARSACVAHWEDAADAPQHLVNSDFLRLVTEGFVQELGGTLTEGERQDMPLAPAAIALTLSARFLADHLTGDKYFQVSREGENLDRCRTQLASFREFHLAQDVIRKCLVG